MSRFIESICVLDGIPQILNYHQDRVDRTCHKFKLPQINLSSLNYDCIEKHKFRFEYDHHGITNTSNSLYQKREIKRLTPVNSDQINYSYKHSDRSELVALSANCAKDEEIIIIIDNLVTDSSYANLVFWDGNTWITPNSYLLNGVKRQFLLDQKMITEKEISRKDLPKYKRVSLINAMLDLEECVIEQ